MALPCPSALIPETTSIAPSRSFAAKRRHVRSASLSSIASACHYSSSSTSTVTNNTTTTTKTLKAPQHFPSKPPAFEGDFNSRMLFNRGLHSVKDVDKDSFWPTVEAAGDKLVVVDLYSKWCGPCRLIYPKLVKLSDQYEDVVFLKVDCSNDNKFLFSKMGVGILPTFKIFKNSNLVSEVKGAKYDELVRQIEKARATCEEPQLVN